MRVDNPFDVSRLCIRASGDDKDVGDELSVDVTAMVDLACSQRQKMANGRYRHGCLPPI